MPFLDQTAPIGNLPSPTDVIMILLLFSNSDLPSTSYIEGTQTIFTSSGNMCLSKLTKCIHILIFFARNIFIISIIRFNRIRNLISVTHSFI